LAQSVGPLIDTQDLLSGNIGIPGIETDTDGVFAWLNGGSTQPHADAPVVVITFGSTGTPSDAFVRALLQGFIQAFEELKSPHRILLSCLWAVNNTINVDDILADAATSKWSNIHISRWIAQKKVLSHPSVRLFGTHAGFGSLSEGLYWGLPLLVYPFYFDQGDNANAALNAGIAEMVDPRSATAEHVRRAAVALLTPGSTYAQQAKVAARIYQRSGGVRAAVDILEEEAEIGSSHLQADPNYYYDVYAAALLSLWVLWQALKCIVCRCFHGSASIHKVKAE
jgi:UDP:flavonoid glycosyltransferase YjiC (YdhE family)